MNAKTQLGGWQARPPRIYRVTAKMLAEADLAERQHGTPNQYRQLFAPSSAQRAEYERVRRRPMPSHMVSEVIAETVREETPGSVILRMESWRTVLRPGSPAEVEGLCQSDPNYLNRIACAGPSTTEDEAMSDELQEISLALRRSQEAAAAAEATAVCGAPRGTAAGPCSDAQEAGCAWFASPRPAQEASLRDRTMARPPACPRRMALAQLQLQRSEGRYATGVDRKIPAPTLKTLTSGTPPQARPALIATRAWFATTKPLLALCGPEGGGKRHAACAWLLSQPDGVVVNTTLLMLAALPGDSNATLRRAAASANVVIDDVTDLTAGARGKMASLIAAVMARTPGRIVVTSQLSPKAFEELLRDPIAADGGPLAKRFALYGQIIAVAPWQPPQQQGALHG